MTDRVLCQMAKEARKFSYAPYSGCSVGAALLCEDGECVQGANVECASFSMTLCAERSALAAAVSRGKRSFSAIAVCGGRVGEFLEAFPPCGACLQMLAEFCNPAHFRVLLVQEKTVEAFYLKDLLPHAFSVRHVTKKELE